MVGTQPIVLLKEGTTRERGRSAQSNNVLAARAIADAVRTTLGPKGMDKMLVDAMGDVVITNDGATILKEIEVQHPAAKMVIEVSRTQEAEVGDGTTTAVVVAGELLKRAEDLFPDVHPTRIMKGYRHALDRAIEVLRSVARDVPPDDEKTLRTVARTAMASKGASGHAERLADVAVRAVRAVAQPAASGGWRVDLAHVQIVKRAGGSTEATELVDGILLEKERVHAGMPTSVRDARIALIDAALEIDKPEVQTEIEIRDPRQLSAFLAEEEAILGGFVEKVASTGATVVVCRKGIDDFAQHHLAKRGILAIHRAARSDVDRIARATGARVASDLGDLSPQDLGRAGLVEERRIGDDRLVFVTRCPSAKAVSILVRGGTQHVIDEIERTLEDALGVTRTVIEEGKVVAGAGATEIEVALALRRQAGAVGGREQLAIEAFADAVEVVPRALAENAGLDVLKVLLELRQAHEAGARDAGINVFNGKVENAWDNAVLEPLRVKTQALHAATEAATLILRIDDVIAAKATTGGGAMPKGAGSREE